MNDSNILVIEGSKIKTIQVILLGIGFVLLGVDLIKKGILWGWVLFMPFGLAIPAGLIQLFRNSFLKMDSEGFEVNPGINPWRLS